MSFDDLQIIKKIFEFNDEGKIIGMTDDYNIILRNILNSVAIDSGLFFHNTKIIDDWLFDIERENENVFIDLFHAHSYLTGFIFYLWKMLLDDYEHYLNKAKDSITINDMNEVIQDAIDCDIEYEGYDN